MSARSLNIMLVGLFLSETEVARYQKDLGAILANYEVTDEDRGDLRAQIEDGSIRMGFIPTFSSNLP